MKEWPNTIWIARTNDRSCGHRSPPPANQHIDVSLVGEVPPPALALRTADQDDHVITVCGVLRGRRELAPRATTGIPDEIGRARKHAVDRRSEDGADDAVGNVRNGHMASVMWLSGTTQRRSSRMVSQRAVPQRPARSSILGLVKQRPLGHTGLSVGAIAFGCWRFAGTDLATAQARVGAAVDSGMTLIDTADVYGLDNDCPWGAAEELLGDVFASSPGLRDRVVLATKGGIQLERGVGLGVPYDASATNIAAACDASLRRLKTDVIDLYQIHRPDLLAHPAETANALVALVRSGKVRHLGVSNYTSAQVSALRAHLPTDVPLQTVQPEFSVAHLDPIDDGVLDQAMELGLTPLAWSPLGGGANRARRARGNARGHADPGRSRLCARPPGRSRSHHRHRQRLAHHRVGWRGRDLSGQGRLLPPHRRRRPRPPVALICALTFPQIVAGVPMPTEVSWFSALLDRCRSSYAH
jgi:aryl-alcohol dehydrogenase-like predicted oxidoreductase